MHKHGFIAENINEILGQSNKRLIQEIYGKPDTEIYNSKSAKVVVVQTPTKNKLWNEPENCHCTETKLFW